jgi:hypothetical protein
VDEIDVLTESSQKALEVSQVNLHHLIEGVVSLGRLGRRQHHEIVVAIEELASLEEIPFEHAGDRAIGASSRRMAAFSQPP